MSHRYLQILVLGVVLAMLGMGCTTAIPPGAVAMTCSEATYHSFSGTVANGVSGRYACRGVKGPDGKTAAVLLIDTRVGDKVNCTETAGKVICPNVPLAAMTRSSPWTFAAPGFVFPPVGAGGQ